jgi:thiosulfate dehydrogenase [quinone] large subunit
MLEAPMSDYRRLAIPIGIAAAVLLAYLYNPWINPEGTLQTVVTWAFWILSIVLVVILFQERNQPDAENVEIEGPAFTRFLFNNSRAGLFWLPIRLFVGFEFLEAGLHKWGAAGWTDGTGAGILGYWQSAVAIPTQGHAPITFDWYRDFLNILINNNAAPWFAWLIVLGEIAVGLGLIVGCFTGVAAFFGALMNVSYLLAGSTSTNPVLFTLAIGLMLAWKTAGYYGIDRYLLPMLGTPWKPSVLNRTPASTSTPAPQQS